MAHEGILAAYEKAVSPDNKKQYLAIAREFLRVAGNGELDKHAVDRYLTYLRAEQYADATIELRFRVVRRLYKLAGIPWEYRRHEGPTIRELEVYAPALSRVVIDPMIQAALAGRLSPTDCAYLALSTTYGLRRIEMATLTPERVDLESRLIKIETAKAGRQRYHIIPEAIIPILAPVRDRLIPVTEISLTVAFRRIERALGRAHAPEVGWHAIRRMLVHLLGQTGLSELQIHEFLRWKRSNQNMVSRYFSPTAIVGEPGQTRQGRPDRDVDVAVFAVHPFLPVWGGATNVQN